jgi:drug/metabolite transporter (DMT)-like permease
MGGRNPPKNEHLVLDPRPWSQLATARVAVVLTCAFGLGWAIVEDVFGSRLHQTYDLMQIVWMRYAVHLLIVLNLWGWHRPSLIWRTSRPVYHLLRSLMMLIMPLSFASSLTWGVPVSFTWALFWLSPLMVICLAVAWNHERPSRASWIGILLGSLGVLAVMAPRLPASPFAPLPPLLMALSFSVYVVMTRSLRTEHVEANLFYTAIGVFAALSLFVPSVWITPSLHDLAMMVGIGTVGFVSLLLLDQAVRWAPISATSPALYFQIACASVIVMLTSGHRASAYALIGILLIGAAVALAWMRPIEIAPAGAE